MEGGVGSGGTVPSSATKEKRRATAPVEGVFV